VLPVKDGLPRSVRGVVGIVPETTSTLCPSAAGPKLRSMEAAM
jgi:hypothetical protein